MKQREIFIEAIQKEACAERCAFLDAACGDDVELRNSVEELLAEHQKDGSFFLDAPPPGLDATIELPMVENPGTQIGPYKLLQKVGEGGMGVVYMAEQKVPVKRRVALKIIKPGMDSKQVVARFESERQALAMMDHPNIARVLDAGTTGSGLPYFVMELVKGVPITQYCDEHRLGSRERLLLFMSVCRAVQHAHQKGIIHRDLKPSNVLVAEYDHNPVAKIIDFGVAKATSQELTEKTLFTQFGQIVGTLDYMSPEQAKFNQLDIDTRSDIYSLRVLLYELLTGSTPIAKDRLRKTGLEEILRMIREEEPPRPSTRLSSSDTLPALAACRNTVPARLAGELREDLDWIVVKALAKDRDERYQTAAALAEDIERHLHDRPIEARRPSLVGRARRYVRRHKTAAALTMLVVAASLLAVSLGVVAYIGRLKQSQQQTALKATEAEAALARLEAAQKNMAREVHMPRAQHWLEERRHLEAFQLASEIRTVLAGDPAFDELWESLTVEVNIEVKPAGTAIYYRGARDVGGDWILAGYSPLVNVRLPNTELRFRFANEGYVTKEFQRPFPQFTKWDTRFSLRPEQGDPTEMVFVHGIQAASWNRLPTAIGDFFIDRYEVSNADFQSFVDAGGYETPEYWSELEFERDGQVLAWNEAMAVFVDATGKPGPAGWHGGKFAPGEDSFPVSGVSWFEAMAYAKFAGKSLPTVHHWRWAGSAEEAGVTAALSNFSNRGPTPRGAQEGIGRFEVYDMAGNLKEWCFNDDGQGHRYLLGGAWNESEYSFGFRDFASPWERDFTSGFRCVRYVDKDAPEELTLLSVEASLPVHSSVEREPIGVLRKWYEFDRHDLDVEHVPSTFEPTAGYRHEVVRVNAAYTDERLELHLFLPRQQQEKYETVVWVPGLGVWGSGGEFAPGSYADWKYIADLPASGRIVCQPIYKGTFHRWEGQKVGEQFAKSRLKARDDFIAVSKEVSRAVDYLLTRDDVDPARLIYFGLSLGAQRGPATLATDSRFAAAVLLVGGYYKVFEDVQLPEIDAYQFTPHVKTRVLMINGKYDNIVPLETSAIPFYEDLGCEIKDPHIVLEYGHAIPPDVVLEKMDAWLRDVFR